MAYLENPFCRFTPHFDFDPTQKQSLVVVSLFRMATGYKNFKEYLQGMNRIFKLVPKLFPGFKVRLFVDSAIAQDRRLRWLQQKAQVVEFSCPPFLNPENQLHYGTFGTFTRFFPTYDLPNNDAGEILILDADIAEREMKMLAEMYRVHQETPTDLRERVYFSVFGSWSTFITQIPKKQRHLPRVFAGRMWYFRKLPFEIFHTMLEDMKEDRIEIGSYYGQRSQSIGEGKYRYGIDEYYLNHRLVPFCLQHKHLFSYRYNFQLSSLLYYDRVKPHEKQEILQFLMPKLYRSDKSVAENHQLFEKYTYLSFEKSPEQKEIVRRGFQLLWMIAQRKKFRIVGPEKAQLLLDNFWGCASVEAIKYSDQSIPMRSLEGINCYELDRSEVEI